MSKFLLNLLVENFHALQNSKILEIRIPTLFEFSPRIQPIWSKLTTLTCFTQQATAFPSRPIRPAQLWHIRPKGIFPSGYVHSGVGAFSLSQVTAMWLCLSVPSSTSHRPIPTAPPAHLAAPGHPAPPGLEPRDAK
jgi:hypothetical protein